MKNRINKVLNDFRRYFSLHRVLYGTVLMIIIFSFGIVYAVGGISTGFRVTGSSQTIDAHGTCKQVKTTSGNNVFVPTKTSAEWSAFRNNKPANVSLGSCFAQSCIAAGGTVYESGQLYCRFSGSSCPSGWNSSGYVDTSSASGSNCYDSCSISPQVFKQAPVTCAYSGGTYRTYKVCYSVLTETSPGVYEFVRDCRDQSRCVEATFGTSITAPVVAVYCTL